jgi:hypothetical protein
LLHATPLFLSHPKLYDIQQGQDFTFERFLVARFDVSFRRRLSHDLAIQWEQVREVFVTDTKDTMVWGLIANRVFSTKSVYQVLERYLSGANNKWIWKAKLPLKIKVFMWQLFRGAILTRDNLRKRN